MRRFEGIQIAFAQCLDSCALYPLFVDIRIGDVGIKLPHSEYYTFVYKMVADSFGPT